jgi:RNA-directed DNA polymerase
MTSNEALFDAWLLFRRGKNERRDVQEFERQLEKYIFRLQRELEAREYKHASYGSFFIQDPKARHIRKACVRDRLVHQAVYTVLSGIFEPKFIHDLYSSRIGKGTHRAVTALRRMTWQVSRNLTRPCWALKCDVRKFYDTVDHEILLKLLAKTIHDQGALWLLQEIVESFHCEGTPGKGLPIGNLTSQIFTSIYLNELDQFVKHTLRVKHYLRFADDILLLSPSKAELEKLLPKLKAFLLGELKLELHPKKISIRPLHQGVDFLGYVTLNRHRVLRTTTKRRMLKKLSARLGAYFKGEVTGQSLNQTMQSYLGMLSHADTFELQQHLRDAYCWRTF